MRQSLVNHLIEKRKLKTGCKILGRGGCIYCWAVEIIMHLLCGMDEVEWIDLFFLSIVHYLCALIVKI